MAKILNITRCILAPFVFIALGQANEIDLSLIGAFGCSLDVYADGKPIASLTTVYDLIYVVRIPENYTTVAVQMVPHNTYAALFTGFTSDLKLVTDETWRWMWSTPDSNWMDPDFDDSTWINVPAITSSTAYDSVWGYSMPVCHNCNASVKWFASGYPPRDIKATTMYYRTPNPAKITKPLTTPMVPTTVKYPSKPATHYMLIASDVKIAGASECSDGLRSQFACAQKCTTIWPTCAGFQYTFGGKRECCLLDSSAIGTGNRQQVSGWRVWKAIPDDDA